MIRFKLSFFSLTLPLLFLFDNCSNANALDKYSPKPIALYDSIMATIKKYPIDTMIIDTTDCKDSNAVWEINLFNTQLETGAFNKSKCFHYFQIEYTDSLSYKYFTGVYIASFTSQNFKIARDALLKYPHDYFVLKVLNKFKYCLFENTIIIVCHEYSISPIKRYLFEDITEKIQSLK